MAQLQLTGVTSSLRVLVTSATPPSYKLDLTGSLAWNNSANYCLFRAGNTVVGRHPSWGDYASFYHAATTNTGGTQTNYCLMHSPVGSSYLNASSGQLIYFVNNGGTYTANIGGTGLSVGNGTTGAAYTLDVGGTCRITGNSGIGSANDGNGRLYIYGAGNTSNCLSFANCNGIATNSSTGRSLAGYIRVYIASSVSNGGVNPFGNVNYYIAVYS
jgi:hypothetical protein